MTRAGVFEFPSRDLDDCISYLRRARESSKSRAMTRDGFARAIGLAVGGGGFGKLVGALTSYGLIETGRNQISATDLCEQILYGTPEEQRSGREKSVRGVRLFAETYKKFGSSPSSDQLRTFLREKGGVGVAAAKRIAKEVEKLLRNNSVHLSAGVASSPSAGEVSGSSPREGLVGRLETADYGVLNIRDEISTNLAIDLLTQVKKNKGWTKLGKKRKGPARRPR